MGDCSGYVVNRGPKPVECNNKRYVYNGVISAH
jgi:hypothetical protein